MHREPHSAGVRVNGGHAAQMADDDDLAAILAEAGMGADHPLFARAQAALQDQQDKQRLQLVEQLREKNNELKYAKKRREDTGVELYNFQQQLAKLQMSLEKAHEEFATLNRERIEAESNMKELQVFHDDQKKLTAEDRVKVERQQAELHKLNITLQEVERHKDRLKSDIAVTKRTTHAAENAVSRLEKEKADQDKLIDTMQEQLKSFHQQLSVLEAQLEAQRRETRAANDTLAEALAEMENIRFEQKQLHQQWDASVAAMRKRDLALEATETALSEQNEQSMNIDAELRGLRKAIQSEEEQGETRMGVLKKVEGEAELVQRNIRQMRDKRKKMTEAVEKLQQQLLETENMVAAAEDELFAVNEQTQGLEKEVVKTVASATEVEAQTLVLLSEGTAVEKNAQRSASNINALRGKVRDLTLEGAKMANDLARARVEVLDTAARNDRLRETLGTLDAEIEEKGRAIERYEVEIRRRNDEIERKAKEVDLLNKQLEKLTSGKVEENLGPLEATISQLTRDIGGKNGEGKELQRRWVALQTELVTTVAETNALTEKLARLRSERTVLSQKRTRLESAAAAASGEIAELDKATLRMHSDLVRLNTAIAKNASLSAALAEDTRNLETSAMRSLHDAEVDAASLQGRIDEIIEEKRALIAEIMERERQIMLWERKIKLEKETQEALDPNVGTDVVASMRKEIHRMELRHGELKRAQERLMTELERCIGKREGLATKSTMAITKAGAKQPQVTEEGLRKACAELRRSVRDTERETSAAEARINELEEARALAGADLDRAGGAVMDLRGQEEELRQRLAAAERDKTAALMATLAAQRAARRYEDFEAGRYRAVTAPEARPSELERASEKRERILTAADRVLQLHPHLEPQLERMYMLMGMAAPAQ